jgi:myo-inositol-1(or 4)-monophosphatase
MHDVVALRDLAVAVAVEAGELLGAALAGTRTVATKSTGTDMVTEMDRASEALIVERITAARPDDAILGEEGADRPGSSGVRWVIDPLDGTTNYLYRLPGWNVSVGVEVDGEPAAGAVVVPGAGDVYAAAAGHGASRNGAPITLSAAAPLATCLIGTGFAYDPSIRSRQASFLVDVLPRIRDVRRVGAAAADLCSVAAGRLDAYYESGLAPWDRVAGTIVAREAGARVEVFDEHPLPGVLTVAGHPDRWDELVLLLHEVGVLGGPTTAGG